MLLSFQHFSKRFSDICTLVYDWNCARHLTYILGCRVFAKVAGKMNLQIMTFISGYLQCEIHSAIANCTVFTGNCFVFFFLFFISLRFSNVKVLQSRENGNNVFSYVWIILRTAAFCYCFHLNLVRRKWLNNWVVSFSTEESSSKPSKPKMKFAVTRTVY